MKNLITISLSQHRSRWASFHCAAAWALAAVMPLAAQTAGVQNATLPGHVVSALAQATHLPHAAESDTEPITITVVLNLSDQAGADALKQDFADPISPNFQQTMGQAEYTARFGPSQESWDAVRAYLEANGFQILENPPNRRTMSASGTRAQAQKAFHVTIDDYKSGDRTFHGIASDPAVPAAIAPLISAVFGLTNMAQMQPAYTPYPYTPMSIVTAYNGSLTPAGKTNSGGSLPPGLNGAGQNIGLIEFDGFNYNDVKNWLKFAALPANFIDHLSATAINGGTGPSGCTAGAGCGTTEVLLDIESAIGVAQGANVIVYDAPRGTDYASMLNASGNYLSYLGGGVLSMSWYECEAEVDSAAAVAIDGVISDLAVADGVTLFVATGDNGSTCVLPTTKYPGTINFPSDAPHAVAVGGTTLNVEAGNLYGTESWWLNSGGFGVSRYLGEPSYQRKYYPAATGRSVPDVAMAAGNSIVVCQATASPSPSCGSTPGKSEVLVDGTSMATPLMAAVWSLVNQANMDAGKLPLTAGNGYLYNFPDEFHAASTMTGPGNDFKHVGLGSPDITRLVARIVHPQIDNYYPYNGPASGGTKVTIQGSGFINVEKVTFGGVEATHLTVDSDKQLTVDSPEAPGAEATIEVVTSSATATAAGPYSYNPEIDKVSPSSGAMEGGTMVTLTGHALTTSLTFTFAGDMATGVSCSSSAECTMYTPAHAPGTVEVEATPACGCDSSPLTSATRFTYEGPAITSFTPATLPTTGGLFFQLYGVSLENGKTTVSFGGTDATGVVCVGTGYCYMNSPAHAAGTFPVAVTVNGITATPIKQEVTFKVFPTVTGISPSTGNPGIVVTLTGTGFSTTAGQTIFTFFGIPVTGSCSSTMVCTAVVPDEVDGTATSTAVPVTVNGLMSLDSVVFTYKNRKAPPPCTGDLCN
jgi:hypothetical protein